MVDDKKIEEAACAYEKKTQIACEKLNKKLGGNGFSVTYKNADAAFIDGAHWAISEFLKDLWHTDDGMPESGKTILIKGLECHNTVGGYTLFNTRTDIDLGNFDKKIQWDWFCEWAGTDFKWCYLEDILQKGGEK